MPEPAPPKFSVIGASSASTDETDDFERRCHWLEELVDLRTLQLAEARHKAAAATVAKSAFLANISHEIRTPMSAITGMAYLIRRSQVTPRQANWLDTLDAASKQLIEVIEAVLDMSRIDAGKLVLERAPVAVERIANDVVSMLLDHAAAKRLRLSVDAQPLPCSLLGDSARLQQALLNYACNAVKFTDSGSVTLRIRCDEESTDSALLRFEVLDTGIGIAADTLPRLFTAFEQADNSSTRNYGGSGLGLAIVHQLARLMGGNTGVDSIPGVGSTFWFTARLQKRFRPATAHAAFAGTAGNTSSR